MKRYSAFAVAREAMRHHTGWDRAWSSPEPRSKYDVIIIGAGGHGLATAYYLGKNFGITNVAILEKAGRAVAILDGTRRLSVRIICRMPRPRSMKKRVVFMKRCLRI